jgi:hypothetical protein
MGGNPARGVASFHNKIDTATAMATLAANMSTVMMEKNAEKKTWVYGMASNQGDANTIDFTKMIQDELKNPTKIDGVPPLNQRYLPPTKASRKKRKNGNGNYKSSQVERIFRAQEDAKYNDLIRKRLATSNFRVEPVAVLEMYYRTLGRARYERFIAPLSGELRKLAVSVLKKMEGTVEPSNVKRSQNVLNVVKKQHHMQVVKELPRGIAATHAGMVSAEQIRVPRGSDSLFSAVAQAHSIQNRGVLIADPKQLVRISRRLRDYARKVQCETKQIHFEGALNKDHCRVIGKAESSTKTNNGKFILQPGTYGGETEILALALHMDTTIAVFSATYKLGIYTRVVPYRLYGVNTKNPPIFLLRRLGSSKDPEATAHYDLLYKVKPLQQLPSVQMIKSAREMMNTTNALTGNRQTAAAPPPAPPSPPPQPIQVVVQTPEPNGGGTKSKGGLGGLLDVGSFVGGDMAVVGTLALSCIAAAVQAVRR